MPIKKDGDREKTIIVLFKKQMKYLKDKDCNKSKYVRQAITAEQEGQWEYKSDKKS